MSVLRALQPPLLHPPKSSLPLTCFHRYLSTISSLPPELQPIIGLEIHVQLKTRRKLFSCMIPVPSVVTVATTASSVLFASIVN